MPEPRAEALIARLEKGIGRTLQILGKLSGDQWQQTVYAAPHPWTARDLLAHFVSSERGLLELAQDVAVGGRGAPDGFDYDALNAQGQEQLAGRSVTDLLSDLVEDRQATVDWVRTLSAEDLDRLGHHPALGEISVEAMLTAIYGHQLLHIRELTHITR